MKKTALSLGVLAASAAFVWAMRGPLQLSDPATDQATLPDVNASTPLAVPPPAPAVVVHQVAPAPLPTLQPSAAVTDAPAAAPTATFSVELPRLRPTQSLPVVKVDAPAAPPPPTTVAAASGAVRLADGTYTGPAADAYYGTVQVQVTVQSGQITTLKVLRYPSDRRTSIFINRQALPMLRDEVISAQSARIDIISGATLTSEAFIQSLSGALGQSQT